MGNALPSVTGKWWHALEQGTQITLLQQRSMGCFDHVLFLIHIRMFPQTLQILFADYSGFVSVCYWWGHIWHTYVMSLLLKSAWSNQPTGIRSSPVVDLCGMSFPPISFLSSFVFVFKEMAKKAIKCPKNMTDMSETCLEVLWKSIKHMTCLSFIALSFDSHLFWVRKKLLLCEKRNRTKFKRSDRGGKEVLVKLTIRYFLRVCLREKKNIYIYTCIQKKLSLTAPVLKCDRNLKIGLEKNILQCVWMKWACEAKCHALCDDSQSMLDEKWWSWQRPRSYKKFLEGKGAAAVQYSPMCLSGGRGAKAGWGWSAMKRRRRRRAVLQTRLPLIAQVVITWGGKER